MKNTYLKRRIIDISYKNKLSHIGSCLTAVDIIDEIYSIKKPEEKFVLSSGHSGLGLYCIIEKYSGGAFDAEYIFQKSGVHPDRLANVFNPPAQGWFISPIHCSSGSLGNGLPIAVGMALADRSRNVYCLISDGECSEESIYEALCIAKTQKLDNLKIYCNANGYAAYRKVNADKLDTVLNLTKRGVHVIKTNMDEWPEWLRAQKAHYIVMDKKQYEEALEVLK